MVGPYAGEARPTLAPGLVDISTESVADDVGLCTSLSFRESADGQRDLFIQVNGSSEHIGMDAYMVTYMPITESAVPPQ